MENDKIRLLTVGISVAMALVSMVFSFGVNYNKVAGMETKVLQHESHGERIRVVETTISYHDVAIKDINLKLDRILVLLYDQKRNGK